MFKTMMAGVLSVSLAAAPVLGQAAGPAAPAAPAAPAPDKGSTVASNKVRGDELTPEVKAAVERGLAWLASRQNRDGAFGAGGTGYQAHVGISSLAGVAFMAAGNLPGRGKYGENVKRAVEFMLRNSQESGLLAADNSHGVMYSHGFAMLFLGEVYGMTGDEAVKEKLQKAVRLTQKTQNPQGGWRYLPVPYDADISVTITQVMGLRAARDAGIKVEKEVVDKAVGYVRMCHNKDGGFSYVAGQGGMGGSGWERSGAGLATLFYAGIHDGEEIDRAVKYLSGFIPGKSGRAASGHYFYGVYYGTQAAFLAGGDLWKNWYEGIRKDLLAKQNKSSGAWAGEVSEEFATAIALIALQMPNRYLPVFHGKGKED